MPATSSTTVDFITVIDFAIVRRRAAPPPHIHARFLSGSGRVRPPIVRPTAEIERLTRIVMEEMIRAVRWRRGLGVGSQPPPESG